MLTIYLCGHNVEQMSKFVEFVNEGLAGWGPLVNDEFTISEPHEFEDGEVDIKITIGTENDGDGYNHVMDINYDEMFMPRSHMIPAKIKWYQM